MKKIIVRKILDYDPTFNGKYSKYEGYYLSGLQRVSPRIIKNQQVELYRDIAGPIFCSRFIRARETAKLVSKSNSLKIKALSELNEVTFSLIDLLSEKEYEIYGSNLVRQRFIEAFINDSLIESRESIELRIKNLLAILKVLPNGRYLLVSHSFFMKILQIYLKDKTLFTNPVLLRKYFDPARRTFDNGKGFEFNVK